jgi:hypothetical protein
LYQPRALNLKFLILGAMTYILYCFHLSSTKRFSEANKRKRLRMIDLQNSNLPRTSKEEWELT